MTTLVPLLLGCSGFALRLPGSLGVVGLIALVDVGVLVLHVFRSLVYAGCTRGVSLVGVGLSGRECFSVWLV